MEELAVVDFSTTPPRAANMGVIFRLVVPGAGAVFLDVGRIALDRQGNVYFQAGPHQFFDSDLDALCAALEQPCARARKISNILAVDNTV